LVDDAVRIIVGDYSDVHHRYACFTRRDGSVWCWGSDLHAELGMGVSSPTLQPYPVQVPLANDSPVVELSTFGRGGTCALHEDDSVSCWGRCREELVDPVAQTIRYYDCVAPYNLSPREDWLAAQP